MLRATHLGRNNIKAHAKRKTRGLIPKLSAYIQQI